MSSRTFLTAIITGMTSRTLSTSLAPCTASTRSVARHSNFYTSSEGPVNKHAVSDPQRRLRRTVSVPNSMTEP
ncbi:hypothetical protein BDP81DRAFT_422796 [Colletotrichum phormii]|uniref:Uncharacterized protein n=1 Tax=Colletotrichum phormii TaxID=359342 RepID=A0AAJ0EG20_9PEZI|nr:uncharacterized protein BDP81DRAFT_422796 [Colletotrichum phormii]KAK1638842.1 hypothetical protein BDP81DRAFT_422796 [Colletotrichum phormii]